MCSDLSTLQRHKVDNNKPIITKTKLTPRKWQTENETSYELSWIWKWNLDSIPWFVFYCIFGVEKGARIQNNYFLVI